MTSLELPPEWKLMVLRDFAEVKYGKARPKDTGSIPVIGSGGKYGYTSQALVDIPTIVIGRKGTAGLAWLLEQPCWPSDTTFYLHWKDDPINLYYLYYHLQGKPLSGEHARTTLPSLLKQDLENYSLFVPPLPEQRAIARALRAVQAAREARLREIALERERKAALMEHLFTHGTRGESTKMTEIGEMPESWSMIQLEEACIKIVDCPHSTPHFSPAGVLVVRNFNIRNGRLDLKSAFYITEKEYIERIKRCEPVEGDVLFSREAPVGEACLVPPDIRLCLGQRMMLLRVDTSKLNRFFLVQAFYSSAIRSIMMAISSGVTAKHLNVADVKRLRIPFPSTEEQGQISGILSSCDSKISTLDHEVSLLDELFRTMLEELMSGKLPAKGLIEP